MEEITWSNIKLNKGEAAARGTNHGDGSPDLLLKGQ